MSEYFFAGLKLGGALMLLSEIVKWLKKDFSLESYSLRFN